ncbi:GntR family transcriptional regulator [Escherichia coli]
MIFSALQKRDGDAVERAMTQRLQEIREVRTPGIRRKTATGLAKSNSFTLSPSGMSCFLPPYGSCMHEKRCELDQKQNISLDRSIFLHRYVGFDYNQKEKTPADDLRS